ncbi:LysM peptidoglycan-binding domain-containing protein [Lachnospiraceae bacterium ZAX-1]
MDIYLTDLKTNSRLRMPMLPESISVSLGSSFYDYQIIDLGEVRIPSGQQLNAFSWSGTLPGSRRKKAPYVRKWKEPKKVHAWLKNCMDKKRKLRLLATGTPINCNVYIESYSCDFSGGYGDYTYQISLIQAKDLKVRTIGEGKKNSTGSAKSDARPEPPPKTTYTVVKGDTLWGITQRLTGNGARYMELYEPNRGIIGPDPNLIYPGQVLVIPF